MALIFVDDGLVLKLKPVHEHRFAQIQSFSSNMALWIESIKKIKPAYMTMGITFRY